MYIMHIKFVEEYELCISIQELLSQMYQLISQRKFVYGHWKYFVASSFITSWQCERFRVAYFAREVDSAATEVSTIRKSILHRKPDPD
jgi:hypothetical protein